MIWCIMTYIIAYVKTNNVKRNDLKWPLVTFFADSILSTAVWRVWWWSLELIQCIFVAMQVLFTPLSNGIIVHSLLGADIVKHSSYLIQPNRIVSTTWHTLHTMQVSLHVTDSLTNHIGVEAEPRLLSAEGGNLSRREISSLAIDPIVVCVCVVGGGA